MISFKKVFIWHMGRSHWERAMDKYELISKSLKNIHQRYIDKVQHKPTSRPMGRKD